MNTILKNVVKFTGLAVGVPAVQPHYLNLNGTVPLLPQFVATNAGGFTVAVTDLTVTVTRTLAAATGNVLVFVEHWHTIEEVLPPGDLATLVPFLIQPGTGGGGGGVDTDGVTIGGDGTAGNALYVIPSGLDAQVAVAVDGVTITGDGTTANPLIATAPTTVTTDGTTITGDGSIGSPLAVVPSGLDDQVTVAVDGVTITGDGTTGSPLVAVFPADTGITELTTDVLAGPGSGTQAATVVGLQGNPIVAAVPAEGQVLTWDGAQWVPGSVPTGGSGGGGIVLYLNEGVAPDAPTTNLPLSANGLVSVKELGKVAEVPGVSVTSSVLSQVNYDLVAGFVTDLGVPGVTEIPAGLWDLNLWASSTASQPNHTLFQVKLYTYDGVNAPTLFATSNPSSVYDPASTIQYATSVLVPQTTILATDRIYVEVLARATTGSVQVTFYFGDNTPTHLHTTLPSVAGTGIAHVLNGAFVSPASPVILSSAAEVTGILPIANGGTATSAIPANGKLLIGNGTGYALASLTAGSGISIADGAGSITVTSTVPTYWQRSSTVLSPATANDGVTIISTTTVPLRAASAGTTITAQTLAGAVFFEANAGANSGGGTGAVKLTDTSLLGGTRTAELVGGGATFTTGSTTSRLALDSKDYGRITAINTATSALLPLQLDIRDLLVNGAAGSSGNVLTSQGAGAAPIWAAPAASGITQLTGDVTAGPGSGSQAATVVALQGTSVSNAAPSNGNVLTYNSGTAKWAPAAPTAGSSVIAINYTATGSEGADFFVSLPAAQPTDTYQIWWAPKGVTNIPLLDLPDSAPTDRTTAQFRVLIGGTLLTAGDKLVFFVLPA